MEATFFFSIEVSKQLIDVIANEVGEICGEKPETVVDMGNGGWFINVKARNIRDSDKNKVYTFLSGVEFTFKVAKSYDLWDSYT